MSLNLSSILNSPIKRIELSNLPNEYQYELCVHNIIFKSIKINDIQCFDFTQGCQKNKLLMEISSEGVLTKEQSTKYMCFQRCSNNIILSTHPNTPYKITDCKEVKISITDLKNNIDVLTLHSIPTVPTYQYNDLPSMLK
jgi:hypothetical protein